MVTAHATKMQRRRPSSSTPSLKKALTIALGAFGLSVLATMQSAASVIARIDPSRAVVLAPWDGDITARLAKSQFLSKMQGAQDPRDVTPDPKTIALALRAYRMEPLNPSAVAILAGAAPRDKRTEIYAIADQLSRRDPLLQSKLLADRMSRSDLVGALRTFNQILAVRTDVRDQVLDQLVVLMRQKGAPQAFYNILKDDPEWTNRFLSRVAEDQGALVNLVELRRKLPPGIASPETNVAMVRGLIAANMLPEAYAFYEKLPRKDESSGWASDIPPLDWSLANTEGLRAQVEGTVDDLTVDINPGRSGTIARRILPASRRPIRVVGRAMDKGENSVTLTVDATCLEKPEIISTGKYIDGTLSMTIPAAPRACDFIMLRLVVDNKAARRPSEFRLSSLRFVTAS